MNFRLAYPVIALASLFACQPATASTTWIEGAFEGYLRTGNYQTLGPVSGNFRFSDATPWTTWSPTEYNAMCDSNCSNPDWWGSVSITYNGVTETIQGNVRTRYGFWQQFASGGKTYDSLFLDVANGHHAIMLVYQVQNSTTHFVDIPKVSTVNFNDFNGTPLQVSGYYYAPDLGHTTDQVVITHMSAAPLAVVPLPASWALMLGGLAVVGGARRRSSRTQAEQTHLPAIRA